MKEIIFSTNKMEKETKELIIIINKLNDAMMQLKAMETSARKVVGKDNEADMQESILMVVKTNVKNMETRVTDSHLKLDRILHHILRVKEDLYNVQ